MSTTDGVTLTSAIILARGVANRAYIARTIDGQIVEAETCAGGVGDLLYAWRAPHFLAYRLADGESK